MGLSVRRLPDLLHFPFGDARIFGHQSQASVGRFPRDMVDSKIQNLAALLGSNLRSLPRTLCVSEGSHSRFHEPVSPLVSSIAGYTELLRGVPGTRTISETKNDTGTQCYVAPCIRGANQRLEFLPFAATDDKCLSCLCHVRIARETWLAYMQLGRRAC